MADGIYMRGEPSTQCRILEIRWSHVMVEPRVRRIPMNLRQTSSPHPSCHTNDGPARVQKVIWDDL